MTHIEASDIVRLIFSLLPNNPLLFSALLSTYFIAAVCYKFCPPTWTSYTSLFPTFVETKPLFGSSLVSETALLFLFPDSLITSPVSSACLLGVLRHGQFFGIEQGHQLLLSNLALIYGAILLRRNHFYNACPLFHCPMFFSSFYIVLYAIVVAFLLFVIVPTGRFCVL